MALFCVRNLAVAVAGKRLLEGLDLELDVNEIVVLQGPSGSGKSTTLRAIAGLLDPTDGQLLLEGRSPAEIGWPLFRRKVSLVAQRPVLLDGDVRANLAWPFGLASSQTESFPETCARQLLERVGLEDDVWTQSARSLSEGQKQRVCLLRALLVKPSVLLLDEPTSALDKDSMRAFEGLLLEHLATHEAAAIVVTHDDAQVDRLGARRIDLATIVQKAEADG